MPICLVRGLSSAVPLNVSDPVLSTSPLGRLTTPERLPVPAKITSCVAVVVEKEPFTTGDIKFGFVRVALRLKLAIGTGTEAASDTVPTKENWPSGCESVVN